MKTNAFKMLLGAALASLALTTANSNAQTQPPGDFVNGFDNATSGSAGSTASWIYWYNGAGSVSLDTSVFKTGTGSLKVTIPFTLPYRTVDQGAWFGNWDNVGAYDTSIVYDGTYFTNIECDVLMSPSNPVSTNGDFGVLGIGLEDAGTPNGAREAGTELIPGSASNTWFHVAIPVNRTASYMSTPGVIGVAFTYSTYDNGGQPFLTNPVTMHIDNLVVHLGTVSNPPPVVSLSSVSPGLNFVQGSISGQYDRQNIRTANSPGLNYSWVGAATAGNPVTYSFNISKWNGPDLNYHIYFNAQAGAGGASAPDYNQPNVMIFQVSPISNNQAVATITWKTNSPSSGTSQTSITITNSTILGNWQLQFTSDTNGAITPPGGSSNPFLVDPGLAAALANPVYVTFGINPAVNSNGIVGESVVVSQIGITGLSSLNSTNTIYTDNFVSDSAFDTNSWQVNALFPASIVFVPTTSAYSLNWTIPAAGFVPEVNTNLSSPSSWQVLSLPTIVLTPGERAQIPKSILPAGNKTFFRLAKLVATQMQVLLPGETNAPNTVNGYTGTPTAISLTGPSAGTAVVTVNACDANWNIVPINGNSISFTSSDGSAALPGSGSFVNGTTSGTIGFSTTGPQTVTATASSGFSPAMSQPVTITN
ncbi:MAG: hypothetical protein ABSC24_04855 [Verrucomicrobiota bacterium]